jgi:gliding motility-associated lipoprotein GldH
MRTALKNFIISLGAIVVLVVNGCVHADQNTVIDQNKVIADQNWPYVNKIGVDFKIDDIAVPYNLYLNLRITPDYKYSNIFVLVHQTGPNKQIQTTRFEFKLANPDGEWLGEGSGNLYSYQAPFRLNYKFAAKGTYHIELEQNMRDSPLRSVSDVGLRVEKAD